MASARANRKRKNAKRRKFDRFAAEAGNPQAKSARQIAERNDRREARQRRPGGR